MKRVISIDPGLKACGIAEFRDGVLIRCDCIRVRGHAGPKQYRAMSHAIADWIGDLTNVDVLAIEHMETRRGRTDAHAALIDLSHVSGGIWALVDAVKMQAVLPRTWTHMRSKAINAQRVRDELSEDETSVLRHGLAGAPRSRHKEIFDAIGIGLHICERWN